MVDVMIREQLPRQAGSMQNRPTQGPPVRSSAAVGQSDAKDFPAVRKQSRDGDEISSLDVMFRCPNTRLSPFLLPFSSHSRPCCFRCACGLQWQHGGNQPFSPNGPSPACSRPEQQGVWKEQDGLPPPRAIICCTLYGMLPQAPVLLAPCTALPTPLLSLSPEKSHPAKLCFSSIPYLSPVLPHLDRLLARTFQVWQRHYHPRTERQCCALPW